MKTLFTLVAGLGVCFVVAASDPTSAIGIGNADTTPREAELQMKVDQMTVQLTVIAERMMALEEDLYSKSQMVR